jgi:hypothetical protein
METSSRDTRTIMSEWDKLDEERRKELIPILLHSIVEWRIWSDTPATGMHWLENQFRNAGIPFRDSTS